jgi:hypothetical protein
MGVQSFVQATAGPKVMITNYYGDSNDVNDLYREIKHEESNFYLLARRRCWQHAGGRGARRRGRGGRRPQRLSLRRSLENQTRRCVHSVPTPTTYFSTAATARAPEAGRTVVLACIAFRKGLATYVSRGIRWFLFA